MYKQSINLFTALLVAVMSLNSANAAVKTETIEYQVGDTTFSGYLAYDDAITGPRPGVLVVHEWWGHNDFARQQAERLAAAGYTAFALDMYGDGKLADHPDDAMSFMREATGDPAQIRQRFEKAMTVLQNHATVDAGRIAAQGYCFGGAVVLNMARLGLDLKGVVSYHGALGSPINAEPGTIHARIQVYTGGADPMVPAEQVAGFAQEMQNAAADYVLVNFPGVLHSFTNPEADTIASRFGMPVGYDEAAATRAWEGTLHFYREIFHP
ncbi:MAG: dienelactone hydrolase family protein [Marinobacter sp.]|nr:dienelactone hydrolase family protein [Marinobacter sp.]